MVWYHRISPRTFSYQPAIPLMRLKCEKEKSGGSFHCGRLVHPNSPACLIIDSPTSVGNRWSQPTHTLDIGKRDRCEIFPPHSSGAACLSLITRKLNRPGIPHVTGGDHGKCNLLPIFRLPRPRCLCASTLSPLRDLFTRQMDSVFPICRG